MKQRPLVERAIFMLTNYDGARRARRRRKGQADFQAKPALSLRRDVRYGPQTAAVAQATVPAAGAPSRPAGYCLTVHRRTAPSASRWGGILAPNGRWRPCYVSIRVLSSPSEMWNGLVERRSDPQGVKETCYKV